MKIEIKDYAKNCGLIVEKFDDETGDLTLRKE